MITDWVVESGYDMPKAQFRKVMRISTIIANPPDRIRRLDDGTVAMDYDRWHRSLVVMATGKVSTKAYVPSE